jgi:hypothetical protein
MPELLHLPEPSLLFGYEQAVEDPWDGLTLFGPLDAGKPYGIRAGAIGTPEGLRRFENWVQKIQGLVTEPKASGKLMAIRRGVCYIGLAFKVDEKSPDPRSACCAAQMFLDSGDGVVLKGAVGPWYNPKRGEFHLSREAAREVVAMAIESYVARVGEPPAELFLHGKVRFNDEEWHGFIEGTDSNTRLVGVRIREDSDLKLYRRGEYPVLRGLAYISDERTVYLWTKGFVPRLQTYPGREVPWPLLIDVCRGEADITVVLSDIMALTKLNYNSCSFAGGVSVTLRFADAVGEILTAGPLGTIPPLAFKHYI